MSKNISKIVRARQVARLTRAYRTFVTGWLEVKLLLARRNVFPAKSLEYQALDNTALRLSRENYGRLHVAASRIVGKPVVMSIEDGLRIRSEDIHIPALPECSLQLPPGIPQASKVRGVQACQFVSASDLVPKRWCSWFWGKISENAPFSWGDNNRSLVTASCFADHCQQRLDDSPASQKFLAKVRALGEMYIDLES